VRHTQRRALLDELLYHVYSVVVLAYIVYEEGSPGIVCLSPSPSMSASFPNLNAHPGRRRERRRVLHSHRSQFARHGWCARGVDRGGGCRANICYLSFHLPHMARAALLRHGGQEPRPLILGSNFGSLPGVNGAAPLVPPTRRARIAVLCDVLGDLHM